MSNIEKEVYEYTIIIIENLIREIEKQGRTSMSVTDLRKFLQNLETRTHVSRDKYMNKHEKYET